MSLRVDDRSDDYKPTYGGCTLAEVRARGGCLTLVNDSGRSVGFHWCSNSAKPGTNFCGIHSDEAEARRERKREERERAWREKWARQREASAAAKEREQAYPHILAALEAIRAGHNDPRGLATEVLAQIATATPTATPVPRGTASD